MDHRIRISDEEAKFLQALLDFLPIESISLEGYTPEETRALVWDFKIRLRPDFINKRGRKGCNVKRSSLERQAETELRK